MPLNRPTASELVEALKEYYEQRLSASAAVTGEASAAKFKFHDLVAQNVLSIVQRECEIKSQFENFEQQQLQALVDEMPDLDLSQNIINEIDNGFFDDREKMSKLLKVLKKTTLLKLSIDNPNYSTYLRLTV